MFGFCPLSSGSQGNCIYLGSSKTKILIDCGISGRRCVQLLEEIGVGIDEIDAVLVSHEHGDHIRGLKVLAFRYGIPVLANHETAKAVAEILGDCPKFKIFSTGEAFEFGDFEIRPFSIQHDAADPVAFTIHFDGIKLGFCTDLGFVSSLVLAHLQECDYLYVEANHEPSMVHSSPRPMVYKQRVLGRSGHLSNEACAQLLNAVFHEGLKHVHLAHLSSECNSPEVAINVISEILAREGNSVELSVAYPLKRSREVLFEEVLCRT